MMFDTSFIIDVMCLDTMAMEKLKALNQKGEMQIVSTPTLFELYSGVAQSNKPEAEKEKISYTVSGLIVWNLDNVSAKKAGEVHGKLAKENSDIGVIDSMIGSIALVNGEKILTRNVKHFSKIPGLQVETY